MKKFLSLVLALVMTMSLVTISAGATEYKDFTDKDEIQYAEAVTVLNKLGIITGYSEGDFRPEGELTRGAAAKILVSLLIGPDAANALGNESSPYPDVPAGNTFAGVISYCKTAKIINGYGDGTFRPQGTLTGYAFAKMLLGAVGYKSEYEGFTGAGWNMNVARLGGEAGLFDRISFNGNATVTREQACQLALNTLKATMVEYSGGMNITNGDQSVVVNPNRSYKTSNQEFASHIKNRKVSDATVSAETPYTVEFGEEHFVDLRLDTERGGTDVFGRPSNVWSWKKVTIGTFPVEADFIFTEQTEHRDATESAKNRKTGLGGYDTDSNTELWVNGEPITSGTERSNLDANKVFAISDLTDNGTVVEVYVSDTDADYITDVVVIKTQLMEVRRVASDYVSLQMYDNGNSDDDSKSFDGYNQKAINKRVDNVQAEDDCYGVLSGLKAGDIVAVAPVLDGGNWKVGDVYVPETVSGAITGVVDYGATTGTPKGAVSVTVGGTEYKIALWNKKLYDVTADVIKATKKDVTLYLDKNGNAMLAKDIGATSEWMVIGAFRQALENGRMIYLVTGWDISGTAVELNVGNVNYKDRGMLEGDLVKYESTTSNIAEWKLSTSGVNDVWTGKDADGAANYQIKASNTRVALGDPTNASNLYTYDKNVKFIYVNFSDDDNEVESIEVKTTRQGVTNEELKSTCKTGYTTTTAQACVNKDGAVKAVVVKGESNEAIATNMLYIRDYYGSAAYDSTNKMVYGYRVAMNTKDGFNDDAIVYSYERLDRGDFASYTAVEHADKSDFYTLRRHNDFVDRTTGTYGANIIDITDENAGFVKLNGYCAVHGGDLKNSAGVVVSPKVSTNTSNLGIGEEANIVDVKNANFLDLRSNSQKTGTGKREIATYDDLKAIMMYNGVAVQGVEVVMIVNDNPSNDGFRTVSMVVVLDDVSTGTTPSDVDGRKTLDDLKVDGKAPVGTAFTVECTEAHPSFNEAPVTWDYTGKSIKVEVQPANGGDPATGWTDITSAGKFKFESGATSPYNLKVTVTPVTGAAAVYNYTVTVNAWSKPAYFNSTVLNKKADGTFEATAAMKGATLTTGDYNGNDKVSVAAGTGVLTAPVVLTGVRADTKDQITEAVTKGTDWVLDTEFTRNPGDGTWAADAHKGTDEITIVFDEDTADALVGTKTNPAAATQAVWQLVAVGTTVEDIGGANAFSSTAVASMTIGSDETPIEALNVVVVPGALYTKEVYTKWAGMGVAADLKVATITGATLTYTPASDVPVTYDATDGKVVKVGDDIFVKEGAVFSATLTLGAKATNAKTVTADVTDGSSSGWTEVAGTKTWTIENPTETTDANATHTFTWTAGAAGANAPTAFTLEET